MPPKPRIPQLVVHHDSGSPDPLDTIPRRSRQPSPDSIAGVDSDPSPPVRAPKVRRMRQAPPGGHFDQEWSPHTNRPVHSSRSLAQSPDHDEGDSSGAVPTHETSDAGLSGKLDFEAVSSDSDAEDVASNSIPRRTVPDIPRPVSPDVTALFGQLDDEDLSSLPHSGSVSSPEPETQSSEESSPEDEDTPLIPPLPSPPPPRVWHSADGVGAVLVPVRDDSKFASGLQDAEWTMASQIASALSDPRNEGLGSATFQTLLDAFLLPRLKGRNCKGEKVKMHQYSQLAARRGQQQSATAREHAQNDLDMLARMYKLDTEDAENLDAVAMRRVPDMTSMVVFEEKVLTPDGLNYRLATHRGPKMCITEIKSFDWSGDHSLLDHVLSLAVLKAHKQNYVAAQFLFIEDERLDHVASFVGVGPVWLYGEWHRTQYHDLHGMPLPRNPAEVKRYKEREAVETPTKAGPSRKRPRVYSPEGGDPEQVDDGQEVVVSERVALPVRGGPNTRAVIRSEQSDEYLSRLGSTPWTAPDHIQEIFTRRRPGEIVKPKQSGPPPLPYLYVLDPDGRTYEAFDAIIERIRGWYTGEGCRPAEYRIIFDEDPYAGGSCPATMAKLKGKARE